MQIAIAFLIIAVAVYLVVRGVDVRLVLFSAGLVLASVAMKPWVIFDEFLKEMGNAKTIGPICAAMGYAFVLRATGSDQEMVRLLIAPIHRVGWLLVPGCCAIGFLTNMAITSQTAVAASVGAIIVPLMIAARYHPIIIGATLVLGCSGGGSLFNPGEAVVVSIADATRAPISAVLDAMFLPELLGFAGSVVAFTLLSRRAPALEHEVEQTAPVALVHPDKPIDLINAMLPPLPIAMLFLLQPRFHLFPSVLKLYPEGLPASHAMLGSTMIAFFVNRKNLSAQTKAFFEGMGFAYVNVISVIIAATCFIKGLEAVGVIKLLVSAISSSGVIGKAASGVFPWALGVLCGSGTAPCVAFCKAVLPGVAASDAHAAVDLGVLAAIGSSFGRTMSPVAAVVFFTATLLKVPPMQIVKRTAPALAVGAVVAFAVAVAR